MPSLRQRQFRLVHVEVAPRGSLRKLVWQGHRLKPKHQGPHPCDQAHEGAPRKPLSRPNRECAPHSPKEGQRQQHGGSQRPRAPGKCRPSNAQGPSEKLSLLDHRPTESQSSQQGQPDVRGVRRPFHLGCVVVPLNPPLNDAQQARRRRTPSNRSPDARQVGWGAGPPRENEHAQGRFDGNHLPRTCGIQAPSRTCHGPNEPAHQRQWPFRTTPKGVGWSRPS